MKATIVQVNGGDETCFVGVVLDASNEKIKEVIAKDLIRIDWPWATESGPIFGEEEVDETGATVITVYNVMGEDGPEEFVVCYILSEVNVL